MLRNHGIWVLVGLTPISTFLKVGRLRPFSIESEAKSTLLFAVCVTDDSYKSKNDVDGGEVGEDRPRQTFVMVILALLASQSTTHR